MNVDQMHEIWRGLKMFLRFDGYIAADAMHINIGLFGFFVFLALFRSSKRAAIYAWLAVFFFQSVNEATDIFFDLHTIGTVKEWNSIRDFILTLLWPTIFTAFLLKKQTEERL